MMAAASECALREATAACPVFGSSLPNSSHRGSWSFAPTSLSWPLSCKHGNQHNSNAATRSNNALKKPDLRPFFLTGGDSLQRLRARHGVIAERRASRGLQVRSMQSALHRHPEWNKAPPDPLVSRSTPEELAVGDMGNDFYKLARDYGVVWRGCRGGWGQNGRGLFAARDIPYSDKPRVLLEIPMECMLTISAHTPWLYRPDYLDVDHPLLGPLTETDEMEDWDVRLAMLLLLGVRDDGIQTTFWAEYSQYLPTREECSSLLLATKEELEELQDPELAYSVLEEQQRVEAQYQKHFGGFVPRRLKVMCPSLEVFQWVMAMVHTRHMIFEVHYTSQFFPVNAIVAFADQVNHSDTPNCYFTYDGSTQAYQLVLDRGYALSEGQELTLAYLPREANQALMRHYGFSLPKNVWEKASFTTAAQLHQDSFLDAFRLQGDREEYFYNPVGKAPKDSFEVDGHTLAAARAFPLWKDGDCPALPSEELAASKEVAEQCRSQLAGFATTLEEDEKLLDEVMSAPGSHSARYVAAIRYRMERKAFLHKMVEVLGVYSQRVLY